MQIKVIVMGTGDVPSSWGIVRYVTPYLPFVAKMRYHESACE